MHARRVVCAVLVIVLVALAAPVSVLAEEGWWAYTGTVLDADTGDPLPYAYVSLKRVQTDVDPEIYATVTDENGHFYIPPYFEWNDGFGGLWGEHTFVVVSRTGWDHAKSRATWWGFEPIDLGTLTLQRDPEVIPHQVIFGQDRYETATRISRAALPLGMDGAEGVTTTGTVVVASGQSYSDALVAAAVAGVENAPVLLTDRYGYGYYGGFGYYQEAYNLVYEIRRLKPERAIIIGGDEAISINVEGELNTWVGPDDVTRLAGETRFETAHLAAAYVAERAPVGDRTALVGSAYSFADALAASPLSWNEQMPLYLVGREGIRQETLDAIAADGITDVMILGGESAVSGSAEASLTAQLGAGNVDRTGGPNRYATAAMLAEWAVDDYGLDFSHVAIVSGEKFPDALAGGPYQGRTGSVMLLTRAGMLEPVVETALEDHALEIEEVRFFGGPTAVSTEVRRAVDQLLR